MKFSKALFVLILFALILFSCKKESSEEEQIKTTLPNFGNVDLDGVFKNKDHTLENKDSLVAVLDRYYKNVWEKGNLWGGFMVAKGDEILYEGYRGFAQANDQEPINDTVALHVASISKSITAMATLKLVEAGKINLEVSGSSKLIFPASTSLRVAIAVIDLEIDATCSATVSLIGSWSFA